MHAELQPRLSEAEIRRIVRETLTQLGASIDDPTEMQRDFAYLRDSRRTMEQVKNKTFITLVGLLVTGFVTALVVGIKVLMK